MNAKREAIERAFQDALHDLGFDTCDIGYLAQAAAKAVEQEARALADESKNQADAEYSRPDLDDIESDSHTLAMAGENPAYYGQYDYPGTD